MVRSLLSHRLLMLANLLPKLRLRVFELFTVTALFLRHLSQFFRVVQLS